MKAVSKNIKGVNFGHSSYCCLMIEENEGILLLSFTYVIVLRFAPDNEDIQVTIRRDVAPYKTVNNKFNPYSLIGANMRLSQYTRLINDRNVSSFSHNRT